MILRDLLGVVGEVGIVRGQSAIAESAAKQFGLGVFGERVRASVHDSLIGCVSEMLRRLAMRASKEW